MGKRLPDGSGSSVAVMRYIRPFVILVMRKPMLDEQCHAIVITN
ncbi:hypothetical protein BTN49_3134 [Candidatus Enterovibrio escicola]|uniref:Uncharacterized protein n=1 Tax=Candidatus Enterovibrio escicola TaxID=1927127 RepID=A0A2A5SZC3_9GAMM|nr:hypothetical protein BTN49_3134 [Candidatus Enterovibrio escacola]